MKLKEGLVFKVRHDELNHYIQIISIAQAQSDYAEIQLLIRGTTVTLVKERLLAWRCKYPANCMEEGLLEKISTTIDVCLPSET